MNNSTGKKDSINKKLFNLKSYPKRINDLKRILLARIPGNVFPLYVQFITTFRCNLRCTYCEIFNIKSYEMTTGEVLKMLKELIDHGLRKITFTGGEPLLREDLPEFIKFVKKHNVFCNIITNGLLLPKRIEEIKDVDVIVFSLDGPPEVHNPHRAPGLHDKIINAMDICKEYNMKIFTNTVITKKNYNKLDYMLELTKKYNSTATFQPVENIHNKVSKENLNNLLLTEEQLKIAFNYLLEKKKEGYDIGYSYYFLKSPLTFSGKQCTWAGKLFCSILPDGTVIPCNALIHQKNQWKNGREIGFVNAMKQMPKFKCPSCYTGFPEIDRMFSLDAKIIKENMFGAK